MHCASSPCASSPCSSSPARPLDKVYFANQLAKVLRIWCQRGKLDLVPGWLLSDGQLTVYSDDNTVATTGFVWIFSTSTTGGELNECLDHYQDLRRRSDNPTSISDDDYNPEDDDVDSEDEDIFNHSLTRKLTSNWNRSLMTEWSRRAVGVAPS
ncbi:hypothetical protein DL546_001471 [Coniochaeta pulveracea]|uniref:Uncharacterized protein n=1 Tax=Coniochaeta pulveracea TaxID=177199 RepID=A0A420Y9J2_9PEZI|nr:hypothetical protein DL546_001471 [Coniochaeta pulveracea]